MACNPERATIGGLGIYNNGATLRYYGSPGTALSLPITGPVIRLYASDQNFPSAINTIPGKLIDGDPGSYNWTYHFYYDGNIIYTQTGSTQIGNPGYTAGFCGFNTAGWIFDGNGQFHQDFSVTPSTSQTPQTLEEMLLSPNLTQHLSTIDFETARWDYFSCPTQDLLVSNPDVNNPCTCAAGTGHCVVVSGTGSAHNGNTCVTPPDYWSQTTSPTRGLVNPASCGYTMYFFGSGTNGGVPGLTVEELYGRVLGSFSWTFTATLDGMTLFIETGSVSTVIGYTADIVFQHPGWRKVFTTNWEWDYNGPISANPVVVQTLTLNQTRCLYQPNFPYANFWSQ